MLANDHLLVKNWFKLLSHASMRIGISICQNGFLHTKSAYLSYIPFINTSVFGMLGSVNSRNFVPVNVWKTVRRKNDDSSDSMPDGAIAGSGYVQCRPEVLVADDVTGSLGVRDRVIACTPWKVPARTR
jgi:hypothetical protein